MPFSIWIQLLLHLRLLYNSAMPSFYQETLGKLDWARDARVMVVCGGTLDREVFLACGFSNVTISNVDERIQDHDFFAPYSWSFQDAENLKFPDNAFDYAVVHAGLHHCASPHRALLEMYRIAAKGVLCFEARDSALMRIGKRLRLVPDYELAAVTANQQRWGGVRNTCVPNYVYRWTENEIEKTIASNAPHTPHTVRYFYRMRIPYERLPSANSLFAGGTRWLARRTGDLIARVLPKQCNLFAFFVKKPNARSLFPWLKSMEEYDASYAGLGQQSERALLR